MIPEKSALSALGISAVLLQRRCIASIRIFRSSPMTPAVPLWTPHYRKVWSVKHWIRLARISDCNYIYLCARFSTMQTMSGNYPAFCMMICFNWCRQCQDRHPRTDSEISGSGTTFYRRSSYVRNGACRLWVFHCIYAGKCILYSDPDTHCFSPESWWIRAFCDIDRCGSIDSGL